MYLTINHHICQVITAEIKQSLSQSYTGKLLVRMDKSIHPEDLTEKLAVMEVTQDNKKHFFYFVIQSVKNMPGCADYYELIAESSLVCLKKRYHSRAFTNITTHELIKKILTTDAFHATDVRINLTKDNMYDYIEQFNCSDFDLFSRVISEFGLSYYFSANSKSVAIHVQDALKTDDIADYHSNDILQWKSIYCSDAFVFSGVCEKLFLKPGDCFTFSGYSPKDEHQAYRVISCEYCWDESSSQVLGGGEQKLRYQHKIIAMPMDVDCHAVYDKNEHAIPYLTFSAIKKVNETVLNDQGKYHVVSHGNQHAVQKIESFVGDDFGMHFPLPDTTKVALVRREGHPDQPMILGAYHDNTSPSLQNIIKTNKGHMLRMDDTQDRKIVCATPEQHNQVLLQANAQSSSIAIDSKKGNMSMASREESCWDTSNQTMLRSEQDIVCEAGEIALKSVKNNIAIQAGADMQWKAGKNIDIQVCEDMKMEVAGDMLHETKGSVEISVEDSLQIATQDALNIVANQQLYGMAKQKSVLLAVENASLSLSEAGVAKVDAKKVCWDSEVLS